MKHHLNHAAAAMVAFLFMACSNTASNQNATSADSATVAAEQVNTPTEPILTEEGLTPVVIGANVNDLPEAVEGLYASKKYHQIDPNLSDEEIGWDEVEGWYFYDKDGNELFTAEDNEGAIYRIIVNTPTIKTAQGAHVGMSRDQALAIKGAKLIKPHPDADYEIYSIELGKINMTLDAVNAQKVISMSVYDYSAFE